jgi:hypothetical protein
VPQRWIVGENILLERGDTDFIGARSEGFALWAVNNFVTQTLLTPSWTDRIETVTTFPKTLAARGPTVWF